MSFQLKKEYKAALFGITTILLFIWGYNFLKGKDILKKYNTYYAVFDNVDGISNSTPVKMRGLVIGSIQDMHFRDADRKIVLKVNIDKEYFIPEDSKIKISGLGLLGEKNLEMDLGFSPEPARDGDTLQSVASGGFSDILGNTQTQMEELIVQTHSLLTRLNETFNESNRKNLSALLDHLARTTRELNQLARETGMMLAENRNGINNTLSSLEKTSENMQKVSEQLTQADYRKILNDLTESTENLKNLLENLNRGEGTMGKLMKDEELYKNLNTTLKNLDALLKDLKAHPKRYVHFSLFGKKEKSQKQ